MAKKKYISPKLLDFDTLTRITAKTCTCDVVKCPMYCSTSNYPLKYLGGKYQAYCPYK